MNKEKNAEFWSWVVKIAVILAALFVPAVLFLVLNGSLWFKTNWDKVIGISFGVLGCATYILAELTSNQTAKDLATIRDLANSIADYTRKPLTGIIEILHECDKLLVDSVKAGGNIWFVGLTPGIGPPHDIPANREEWRSQYRVEKDFEAMIESIHNNLRAIVGGARTCRIVVLSEHLVEDKLIKPLYAADNPNRAYWDHATANPAHLDGVRSRLAILSGAIRKQAVAHPITDVSNIPLQLIVADVSKNGVSKRACVVFHVGTENIGSGAVQGFYSELPGICEMFRTFTESLARAK